MRLLLAALLGLLAGACGRSSTTPSNPAMSSVVFTATSPPSGSIVVVYLLTGGTTTEYCGQNLPDSPTWSVLSPGWATTYTVTGFQVYRLPCEVTGIRAILHMRNSGLLIPPIPSETIAEATLPVSFQIRRQAPASVAPR